MAATDCGTLRALVVDDHQDGLMLLARLMKSLNCEAEACSEASKCIEIAKTWQPQLIVLDLAMPGMDGFQVAKELRRAGLPPFRLAALTGYGGKEIEQRCRAAGFDDYLLKPVGLDQLDALLRAAREFI